MDESKVFASLNSDLEWVKDRTIFLTRTGSHSYGLNVEGSDEDFKGIAISPQEYYLGFNKNFEQWICNEPDTTVFELTKFMKLATQNNPNCLEILFTEPEDHIKITPLGQLILDNRDLFLSKQLKERYVGYAKAQAHRIKQHRSWLLNKMDHRPTREEFGLPPQLTIEKNQYDAVKALISRKLENWNPDFEPFSESQKIYLQGKVSDILSEMEITRDEKWQAAARTIGLNENLIQVIKKEKEYENKLEEWKNFERWKQNRNPKRAALEEKYGFDLKHGSHLYRLLVQGKEILDTGKLRVKRTHDRELLLAIKNGAWSYEKLIEETDKLEAEVKISYQNSKLPNQPNIKEIDLLCIKIIKEMINIT